MTSKTMTKRNTFFVLAALALLPARGVAQAAPGCGDGGEWTLRRCIDRPRPYEALGFAPLFPKQTRGQSFPSRHCFSAAGIAVAAAFVSAPLAAVLAALACLIAATRVLTGVHYPSDVLAGLAFGALSAAAGFALLGLWRL